ncbi:MAG: cation:proton antiporter, partial [archaeon]|nr:cation:proton antiporter [archaeon]
MLDLGLILLSATVFNYIARLLKQPSLLAYIAAGIFVGPLVLGNIGLSFAGVSVGVTTTEEILILSELGVAFLLFSVGVESNFSKLAELGKIAVIGSVVQVFLTALLVFVFNHFLGLLSFEQAIYLGLIVAFSSTTIVVKLLSDNHEINTLHGRLMIGFLLMQDVLVILALPMLENISSALSPIFVGILLAKVLVLLAFAFILNRFIYPKVFEFATQSEELFFLSAISSVFIFIFVSYFLNFSIAVGAFVAGVTLSTLPYNLEVLHKIRGVRDFLATIFFVTLGIQLTFSFVAFPIALALVLVGIVFVFKPLIYFVITLFSGYGSRVSLSVAFGLAQVSEFSFILANQGKVILDQTPGLYSFIIGLIALSMAITPYFMGYTEFFHGISKRIFGGVLSPVTHSPRLNRRINALEKIPEKLSNHVVVFGGGLVGSGIAAAFNSSQKVIVIDNDSEVVWDNNQRGINAVYGSV